MQFKTLAISAAVASLVNARSASSIPACTSHECQKKSLADGWAYDLPTEAATGRLVQMNESDSESDSSDDEESNIQLAGDYFKPGFSGTVGAAAYSRVMPERFASDDDDIFMRSMIQ